MDQPTFRSRIAALAQKSRKALRLYTSMGRIRGVQSTEYSEVQLAEWREVNADLLRELSAALSVDNSKRLASDIFELRDRYYESWRAVESDVHSKQRELIASAESADFVKAATISRALVQLKARLQAAQAAHHEIQGVLSQSKIKAPTIELSASLQVNDEPMSEHEPEAPKSAVAGANVIPLRR